MIDEIPSEAAPGRWRELLSTRHLFATVTVSLGIVLFEFLTGQTPVAADNLSALLFSIAHHPHPAIQTLRSDLPPMVQEIVDRALQKELPHRYRRAEEFARELRACLQSLAA